LRLKDRTNAGNILGEAIKDIIKDKQERRENTTVLGIPSGGVVLPILLPGSCLVSLIL
jgi:predicted phosphoribosyltransferase